MKRLKAANRRREEETSVLLDHLAPLKKRYSHIILGGDFNFSPASSCYAMLTEFGFAAPATPLLTWDSVRNRANHHFQAQFPPTVFVEDLTFSSVAKTELIQLKRIEGSGFGGFRTAE